MIHAAFSHLLFSDFLLFGIGISTPKPGSPLSDDDEQQQTCDPLHIYRPSPLSNRTHSFRENEGKGRKNCKKMKQNVSTIFNDKLAACRTRLCSMSVESWIVRSQCPATIHARKLAHDHAKNSRHSPDDGGPTSTGVICVGSIPVGPAFTEMITTGALLFGKQHHLLDFDPSEHPVAVQLGGNDPIALAECAAMAEARATTRLISTWAVPLTACKKARLRLA